MARWRSAARRVVFRPRSRRAGKALTSWYNRHVHFCCDEALWEALPHGQKRARILIRHTDGFDAADLVKPQIVYVARQSMVGNETVSVLRTVAG